MTIAAQQALLTDFGGPQLIKVKEHKAAVLQPNEVRVRIESSTVSVTDTLIRKGLYPLLKNKPPFALGYDFVGKVEEIGSDVTLVNVGDRVADICQIGGNATYINRPVDSLLRVPNEIDAADASAMILSGMTAYQIFKHCAKLQSGNSFLIHGGSGALGTTLLQLCRINGIRTVTTASASKHDSIRDLADVIIDYKANDYEEQLKQAAGDGFDAALDFTNQHSFNNSWRLLKPGGRLIACGIQTLSKQIERKTPLAFARFTTDFALLMAKLALWNALPNGKSTHFFGIVNSKRDHPERYQADLDELFNLIRSGKLKPVHQTIPLSEVAHAHQQLDQGAVVGQIVMCNE